MKKKLVMGIFIGAVLVYLSVRGIEFQDVAAGFKTIQYGYVVDVLIALLFMQVLRSWRWGVILRPLEKVDQLSLFSVTSVGFLAIVAIPARLGELARPYLITHKSKIRMTAAIGSIFVERVFDCLTVLFFFVFTLFFTPLPQWLIRAGTAFFLITLCIFAAMIFIITKREVSLIALNSLFRKLPEKYSATLNRLFHQFIDGFKIITDRKLLLLLTALSALIWLIYVAAIYRMFLAFGFTLPCAASFVVMIILLIGITIPTAPGFVGNWHYSCILGLSLFGIPKTDALTFSIVFHFVSVGIVILLGLLFLPFNKFSLEDLKQ